MKATLHYWRNKKDITIIPDNPEEEKFLEELHNKHGGFLKYCLLIKDENGIYIRIET